MSDDLLDKLIDLWCDSIIDTVVVFQWIIVPIVAIVTLPLWLPGFLIKRLIRKMH